jgi:PKD repeat protein
VEVVLSGQPQGTGTTYSNVASPFVVTGLNSLTVYDVYVRDSCGASLYSQWINGTTTTLACPSITAAFTSANSWLGVNFNSGTTTNADSLFWNFGDGNSTSGSNPSHNYASAGAYVVAMSAFSDCGSTAQFIDTIRVCDTLVADFTFTANGDTVNFNAGSSSNATSFSWDLNGVAATGQLLNYKFPNPGTKPVTLTAYNECGDSAVITKNVKVCLAPKASWTYNIISTTSAGMKTQFDASATQNAVTYEWDFGDGSAVVTGQVMPQHTYLTPGLFYKVTLKVTNTCGDASVQSYRLNQIGVEEFTSAVSFELFPNPADDFVTISADRTSLKIMSAHIVDATGKVVIQTSFDSAGSTYKVNLAELADGYYIIKLFTDKGIFQRKLIVK